jgi:hypothetical protein
MVIGSIVAEVHAQPPETRANVMTVDHGDQTVHATSTFAPETTLAVFIVNPPTSCSARRGSVSAVPMANRNVVSCRSGEPMRKPSIHLIQLDRGSDSTLVCDMTAAPTSFSGVHEDVLV